MRALITVTTCPALYTMTAGPGVSADLEQRGRVI